MISHVIHCRHPTPNRRRRLSIHPTAAPSRPQLHPIRPARKCCIVCKFNRIENSSAAIAVVIWRARRLPSQALKGCCALCRCINAHRYRVATRRGEWPEMPRRPARTLALDTPRAGHERAARLSIGLVWRRRRRPDPLAGQSDTERAACRSPARPSSLNDDNLIRSCVMVGAPWRGGQLGAACRPASPACRRVGPPPPPSRPAQEGAPLGSFVRAKMIARWK
jgi:hypothetical protein